jgi:hypothetical protein
MILNSYNLQKSLRMKKMRERYESNMGLVPINNMYSLTSTFIQKQNEYKPEIKNVGMSPKKKARPLVLDLSDLDLVDLPKLTPRKEGKIGDVAKPEDVAQAEDDGVIIVNKVYPQDDKEIDEEGVKVEIDDADGYEETTEETTEDPIEETTEDPIEETTEDPLEETTEDPLEETIEGPIEETTETTEDPIEETTEDPIEETTEEPLVKKVGIKGVAKGGVKAGGNGDVKTIVVTSFF